MENNLLQDHIDDPIKKSVVGMALLGFVPVFSCCGFQYKDEKVSKAHFVNKPYIFIDFKTLSLTNKALLVDIARLSQWELSFKPGVYIDFHALGWESGHPWDFDGCPHRPEKAVLAIHNLEKTINSYSNSFHDKAWIKDGNDVYKNDLKIKYWQYEPCPPWEVTPEIYHSL